MMRYQPKNILVTGGAGFIASHFVRYYQTHYPEVFVVSLDKLTYAGALDNLKNLVFPTQHHFIQGDILDSHLVLKLLKEFKVDTVVHFAAETHVDRSINSPEQFIQANISGSFVLLEACRQYWLEEQRLNENTCRFHHISTDEVYGSLKKNESAFTELTPYRPNSPYSASKAASDHLVRAYNQTYRLPITITNCSNNYGPNQHREKFIPTIIHCCLQQKPIPVYGDGSNIRDWLYVEDHCYAVDRVIQKGEIGQTYNIGGNNELSNLEVIDAVCGIFNKIKPMANSYTHLISFVKDRAGHDWRYAINSEKIKKQLSWQAKETFISGLNKTVSAYINAVKDKLVFL